MIYSIHSTIVLIQTCGVGRNVALLVPAFIGGTKAKIPTVHAVLYHQQQGYKI